jgi:hypothetical protein
MNPVNAVKILTAETRGRKAGAEDSRKFAKAGSRKVRKGGAKHAKVNEALRPLRLFLAVFA